MRPFSSCRWIAVLVLAASSTVAVAAKKQPPPALAASAYLSRDTHANDKVTVAADPFDTRQKANFFRLDYNGHSIVPIRVIIANDSDTTLDLNQVRIQLIASDGTKIPAATPEELNRRMFRFNDIKQRRIPGTTITYRPTPVNKKITDDDQDFSFSQTSIPPHTSANGFLFYDVRDLDDPALKGAELYVKMMHAKQGDKDTELFAFSVPFDAYLASEKEKRDAARAAAATKAASDAEKNAADTGDDENSTGKH